MNFGHAAPRCDLQYGAMARVDMKKKKLLINGQSEFIAEWEGKNDNRCI